MARLAGYSAGRTQGAAALAENAADAIRQRICEQGLKPGHFLGTENDLAEEFDISRNAIRDALCRLRGLGLVDSRRRKGVIVAQSAPAEIFGLTIPQYVIDHATLTELAEYRCWLEMAAVEEAVTRATDADVERLKHLAKEFRRAVAEDPERVGELEIEFHKTILSATRNRLLTDMHHVVVAYFRRAPKEGPADWHPQEIPHAEHSAIAAAFADRDPARARALLRAHFRGYLDKAQGKGKLAADLSAVARPKNGG